MTSHQLARGSGYGSEKPSDGEENLLRGIVSDLPVADNGRDRLAITLPAAVFSVSAQNKSEAAPRKFFDARHAVYPNVGQRTAFDNRERLRRLVESHLLLPGEKAIPEIVTHKFHISRCELSVSALDSSSFLTRAQNAAGWLQPTKRSAVAFHHPLAAFLPREAFVICASRLLLSAASNCRANAALFLSCHIWYSSRPARRSVALRKMTCGDVAGPRKRVDILPFKVIRSRINSSSCATTDLSALPRTAHTKRGAVEATPAPRSHHTARRQRAA